MSTLNLYNTLTKKQEAFASIDPSISKLYCCGPTVYNFAHIGNLRTYIFEDILVKTLKFFDHKICHVMNITDVGHLASDADEGEDKMILAMKREGKKSKDIAEFYTNAFFKDCEDLNISKPNIICKATDHINEMIELIKTLVQKDYAYISNGNVYFDVSRLKDYGKLAGLSLEALQSGARIEVDNFKRNPHDFVLWFTKSKFENQELMWDSPWGIGYPGWHIECSAMSIKYLGETFDIHCGGIDHIPVHHTNEIAQSECATGKEFSRFWLHGGFLVENNNEKMSKSKGEFLTLEKLKTKGYDPLSYRYLCLTAHYRGELSWSWDALDGAQKSLTKLYQRISKLYSNNQSIVNQDNDNTKRWINEFKNKIGDDLNTPKGLACLYDLISDKDITNEDKLYLISKFDTIFSLNILKNSLNIFENDLSSTTEELPEHINRLISNRELARKNKNFTLADQLRKEIEDLGYELKDSKSGPLVKRK